MLTITWVHREVPCGQVHVESDGIQAVVDLECADVSAFLRLITSRGAGLSRPSKKGRGNGGPRVDPRNRWAFC